MGAGLFVDWDNDGSFATSGDDVTSDVVGVTWRIGGAADHVTAQTPGEMTVTVKNADGKYNPDNSGSSLHGKLKPNRPVWFGLNNDGTISGAGTAVGIFAGFVREIVPGVTSGVTATADIIVDDALGAYARRPTKVAADTDFSFHSLRAAILSDIGETHTDLASEVDTLPLASADSRSALAVLEELNLATGSRHWTNPADSAASWYDYKTVDRHYKLTAAADADINADDVQGITGYRVTAENVVNYQAVDVQPLHFPAAAGTVWTNNVATFGITTTTTTIWATFQDFVTDAVLDYDSTGGAVTATLTNFGTTAKITLASASTSTITNLKITGRQVVRDPGVTVVAEDSSSQTDLGYRAENTLSPTYASVAPLAQGLADFLVWKFGTALKRPAITFVNETPASISRDLYDVITLTIDRLNVSSRRFEIIGISGTYAQDKSLTVTWELQETPNQSALSLFILDTSLLDGSDVLAR